MADTQLHHYPNKMVIGFTNFLGIILISLNFCSSCIIAFQYPPQNPPGYPQQNQAPGAPFVYPPPAAAPGAMAYPPPPPQSSQTLSEKDLLRLNEGPPPYFPQGKIQLI